MIRIPLIAFAVSAAAFVASVVVAEKQRLKLEEAAAGVFDVELNTMFPSLLSDRDRTADAIQTSIKQAEKAAIISLLAALASLAGIVVCLIGLGVRGVSRLVHRPSGKSITPSPDVLGAQFEMPPDWNVAPPIAVEIEIEEA